MLTFDSLTLSNYVTWKDLNFSFENGVTFISGANYSGKSTIFNALLPLLYGEGDIPHGANASFAFLNGEKSYSFSLNKANKNTYSIVENDMDMAVHKIATAKDFISDSFRLSSDLFNTTVLLNGRKDHPLASGKPASRLDYLLNTLTSSLVYQEYADIIDFKYKELSKSLIEINTLKNTLNSLTPPVLPGKEDFEAKVAALTEKQQRLTLSLEHAKRIQDIAPAPCYKSKNISLKEARNIKAGLDKQYHANNISAEKLEKLKKARDLLDRLRQDLKVPEEIPLTRLLAKTDLKILNLTELINREKRMSQKRAEQEYLIPYKDKVPDMTEEEANARIASLTDHYNHAKVVLSNDVLNKNECPVCKSGCNMTFISEKAEKVVATYKSRLSALKEQILINKAYKTEFVEAEAHDINDLEIRLHKLNRLSQAAGMLAGEDLSVLDSHFDRDKVERDLERVNLCIVQLSQREAQIQTEIQRQNPYLIGGPDVDKLDINQILDSLNKSILDINDKISLLKAKQMQYEIKLEAYSTWKAQTLALRKRLEESKQVDFDFEVVKGLKSAFSRDGFRLYKLQMLTDLFVSNLNSLVPILVQEPIRFEAELDKRKCDILATRNGKKSSIFSLSGAESQIFKIVAALALIRCLPASYRADTIMLDEIEANGDERFVTFYARDFIPEIRKSVDKVIVVSPKTMKQLPLQPDRVFEVKKEAGRSLLLKR